MTKDNVMKLDSSYIGRKEMKYLRDVCRHGDRQWVESNFPSLVNYAIYVCSNKQRSKLLASYESYEVRRSVVEKLRKQLLRSK
jgi:hypothetical protein